MSNTSLWQQAWDFYFAFHPNVMANWGYSNGRWPHREDIPEWYAAHLEILEIEKGAANAIN